MKTPLSNFTIAFARLSARFFVFINIACLILSIIKLAEGETQATNIVISLLFILLFSLIDFLFMEEDVGLTEALANNGNSIAQKVAKQQRQLTTLELMLIKSD